MSFTTSFSSFFCFSKAHRSRRPLMVFHFLSHNHVSSVHFKYFCIFSLVFWFGYWIGTPQKTRERLSNVQVIQWMQKSPLSFCICALTHHIYTVVSMWYNKHQFYNWIHSNRSLCSCGIIHFKGIYISERVQHSRSATRGLQNYYVNNRAIL